MQVEHERERKRFMVVTDSGEAQLTYAEPRPGVLDLQHTFVPPEARNQGVANALAESAFDYAREQGLKIIPSCAFVRAWLAENPQHKDLVAD